MSGGKIQALNHAIREAIPHMREVAHGNPNAEVLVRAIKFFIRCPVARFAADSS